MADPVYPPYKWDDGLDSEDDTSGSDPQAQEDSLGNLPHDELRKHINLPTDLLEPTPPPVDTASSIDIATLWRKDKGSVATYPEEWLKEIYPAMEPTNAFQGSWTKRFAGVTYGFHMACVAGVAKKIMGGKFLTDDEVLAGLRMLASGSRSVFVPVQSVSLDVRKARYGENHKLGGRRPSVRSSYYTIPLNFPGSMHWGGLLFNAESGRGYYFDTLEDGRELRFAAAVDWFHWFMDDTLSKLGVSLKDEKTPIGLCTVTEQPGQWECGILVLECFRILLLSDACLYLHRHGPLTDWNNNNVLATQADWAGGEWITGTSATEKRDCVRRRWVQSVLASFHLSVGRDDPAWYFRLTGRNPIGPASSQQTTPVTSSQTSSKATSSKRPSADASGSTQPTKRRKDTRSTPQYDDKSV
jgi:hypothetical protein